jgi:hypothetical protein
MIGDEYDMIALLHCCYTLCEFQREDDEEEGDNDKEEEEDENNLLLHEDVCLEIAKAASRP